MDEPLRGPVITWRFIRRYFVRIVIGSVLAVAAYSAVSVYATYQREQRIAKRIEDTGGSIEFRYDGPDWIPQSARERLPFLARIRTVMVTDFPAELFSELGSLIRLEALHFYDQQITDAELAHLKGLKNLKSLYFMRIQITDAGLEHLNGLTNLEDL